MSRSLFPLCLSLQFRHCELSGAVTAWFWGPSITAMTDECALRVGDIWTLTSLTYISSCINIYIYHNIYTHLSVYVLMQMSSIVVLNLRMSTLGIKNPNFKIKKEDPTSILQYNCTSNRFASRTSFGICPVVFTVQFILTLARQSKAKQNICS